MIIRRCKNGTLTLSCIKKTLFCSFLLVFCSLKQIKTLHLQPKENKNKNDMALKKGLRSDGTYMD